MAPEQPQQPPGSTGLPSFTQPGLATGIAEFVLRFDDITNRMEKILRGYSFDSYANAWKREAGVKPYMNDRGISFTMLLLTTINSKITLIGDKNEQQAYEELYTVLTRYCVWLRTHAKEIDFDPQYYHPLCALIMVSCSSMFSAGVLGLHKDFILGIPPKALERNKPQGGWQDFLKL